MKKVTAEIIKHVPEKPGTYRIYVFTLQGEPISIPRFAAVDSSGLLYIGMTKDQTLRKRLYNFLATSRVGSGTTNHSGGLKYRTYGIVQQVLKEHELFFDYEVCDDPRQRERELLREYRMVFGDTPPLNG